MPSIPSQLTRNIFLQYEFELKRCRQWFLLTLYCTVPKDALWALPFRKIAGSCLVIINDAYWKFGYKIKHAVNIVLEFCCYTLQFILKLNTAPSVLQCKLHACSYLIHSSSSYRAVKKYFIQSKLSTNCLAQDRVDKASNKKKINKRITSKAQIELVFWVRIWDLRETLTVSNGWPTMTMATPASIPATYSL